MREPMDDLAIKADGLWKSYKLGGYSTSGTLRDLAGNLFSAQKKASPLEIDGNGKENSFWALSDISFEIKKGETFLNTIFILLRMVKILLLNLATKY